MASRFDQWVGTAPVKLPIETYRTVAMVNEQKTQQALDNIGQTLAAYEQITPFGKNAEAVYDRAMDNLRGQITEAAKMDLKTPDAKRKINQIIRDPSITRDLKNVMTDSLFAQQRMQERAEYLKKNPNVNTYEYNRAFDLVGTETGDPSKFDPNRFKNMNPLVDYVDVNKIITEGVDKLKANEEHVKEILGNYYHEWKTKGLHEDRIRRHVANQLANNPLVSEQVSRNLENTLYHYDRYDRNAGIQKLASAYRTAGSEKVLANVGALNAAIEKMSKGKSRKELEKDPKYTDLQEQLRNHLEMQDSYLNQNSDKYMDDPNLIESTFKNAFVNGFNEMAYSEKFESLTYNEWAKAQWDLANKMKVAKYKADTAKKLLMPMDVEPSVYDLPEEQDKVQSQDLRSVIGRTPGLEGISKYIDDYGAVNFKDPGSAGGPMGSIPGGGDAGGIRGGGIGPMGSIGGSRGGGTAGPMGGGGGDTGGKGGAIGPMGSIGTGRGGGGKKRTPQEVQNEIVTNLKTYLDQHSLSATDYNGFQTEQDVRKALQDVQKFATSSEKIYNRTYLTTQSNSDELRGSFMTSAATSGMFKNDGSLATPAEVNAMQEFIHKYKPAVGSTPTLKSKTKGQDANRSFFTTRGPNNEIFHVYMDRANSEFMTPVRSTVQQALGDKKGYMINGNDASVSIIEMKPGGAAQGMNIPLAATRDYQDAAKGYWNYNLNKVMGLGYSKEEASRLLNSGYNDLHNQLIQNNPTGAEKKPPVLKTGKGDVILSTPVKYRQNPSNPNDVLYYSEIPLLDQQYRYLDQQGRLPDLEQYIKRGVKSFQNVEANPAMYNNSRDDLRAVTREAAITNFFGDDD